MRDGNWSYKHTYYRRDGGVIGEYYNINTPLEFYPDKTRYVDLEMDVVNGPDGKMRVIEEELLDQKMKLGHLSEGLAKKAKKAAKELRKKLSR